MSKFYKKKTDEERKKEVDLLIEKADKKIEELFTSNEDLREYLDFMGKFYNYSYRNSILIQQQFKGAIAVGSYAFWKEKGFTVNKGEKGIGILVPIQLNDYFIVNGKSVSINKASKEQKELIEKGEIEVFKGELTYKKSYVFDISQTNATEKDLPKIFPNKFLDGNIENYNTFYKALENVANKLGIKIIEPKSELGVAKGISYKETKEVALNKRNSEVQNIKTLIHELAHSTLHRMDNLDEYTRAEKEYQAEMVAYVVTSYFNIEREDYSLDYIKSCTKNTTLNDKKKLLKEVKKTSREFIEVIEETLVKEKEIEYEIENKKISQKELLENKTNNSFSNYKKVNYYDVNRLKEIPIKEVCEQLGLELKRGSNNKLWTKIRDEKSNSCCINLDKNYWYDFGVGYGGDTIKLVEEVRGISSKEAIKELAEMFGIEGENVKNNFYLSKDDYKLIGIESDRATLNLDINLEKQSIEEIKEIEKIYGRSMNELANTNKEKFLDIIREKSIPILIEDKNKLQIVKERINDLQDKNSKDSIIYYGMLEAISIKANKRIEIIEKIGLGEELKENTIEKIDNKEIEEYKNKSKALEVGEVRILKSENKYFLENQILKFPKANDIFKYEEVRIGNIKKEYERENKYYPFEKVKGEIKISEEKSVEFSYDIGKGEFQNLADFLERKLSNTNNQYEIKEFLIEQGVRENDKEEKEMNFITDNFIYDRTEELER